jgi:hypothetical protein
MLLQKNILAANKRQITSKQVKIKVYNCGLKSIISRLYLIKGKLLYFPIQNLLKILSNKSSVVTVPVITPK